MNVAKKIDQTQAKNIWIQAQGLNIKNPFGQNGSESVAKAIKHLRKRLKMFFDYFEVFVVCTPHYQWAYVLNG